MADFDETALRSPRTASQTIRTDNVEPWMVQAAAAGIAVMALLGVVFGIRGAHPGAGVALGLDTGVAVSPTQATPAVGLPKDQQWSTLSGPAVTPPSAAPAKVASAAAQEADNASSETDASESAAAAAVDQDVTAPSRPAPQITPPPPPASSGPTAPADTNGLW
jgi:hypothetical protein